MIDFNLIVVIPVFVSFLISLIYGLYYFATVGDHHFRLQPIIKNKDQNE
ncbi:MAG: hypothetical protein ACTSVY_03690 [Candidatus Helarchaeota archaeon]